MMILLSRSSCWIFYAKAISLIAAFQVLLQSYCLYWIGHLILCVDCSVYCLLLNYTETLTKPTDATKIFTGSSSLFFWSFLIILIILEYFQLYMPSAFELKSQMPRFLIFSFQKLQPSFKAFQLILILSNSVYCTVCQWREDSRSLRILSESANVKSGKAVIALLWLTYLMSSVSYTLTINLQKQLSL